MTEVDRAFQRTQRGDHEGFSDWVRLVEIPLRRSLRSFARGVDVEAVVQEGLLRMWVLAPRLSLKGANASLRYAVVMTRRLAQQEAKRLGTTESIDPNELERDSDLSIEPDRPADPGLRRAILDCIERLPAQPKKALGARLENDGSESDPAIAVRLRMKLNTFLQNIVRARRHLARCLESRGVSLEEFLP